MKARMEHLTFPAGSRIIAVSDIHGNLPYLQGLLEKISFGGDDRLVIVGDLLEKGTQSLATLRYVMMLWHKYHVHMVSGNCDWWYPILHTDALIQTQHSLWYINRKPYCLARQMCEEIGYPVSMDMDVIHMREALERPFRAEFEFLRALPEIIDTPRYTFVHGGLPAGQPEDWDAWKCMKYDNFLGENRSFDKWVVCGHWPVALYREDLVSANPIIDRTRHIASIDGGCSLMRDGQLNALFLPADPDRDFHYTYYDPFPTARALDTQAPSTRSLHIRWGDAAVQVLAQGAEFSRCRHLRTGYEMDVLNKYISTRSDGSVVVDDCTDYALGVKPGDRLSIVEETSRGFFVKLDGVSGWYYGALKKDG